MSTGAPIIDWRLEMQRFHKRIADKDAALVRKYVEIAALRGELAEARSDIKVLALLLCVSLGAIFWSIVYIVGASLWDKIAWACILWGR